MYCCEIFELLIPLPDAKWRCLDMDTSQPFDKSLAIISRGCGYTLPK